MAPPCPHHKNMDSIQALTYDNNSTLLSPCPSICDVNDGALSPPLPHTSCPSTQGQRWCLALTSSLPILPLHVQQQWWWDIALAFSHLIPPCVKVTAPHPHLLTHLVSPSTCDNKVQQGWCNHPAMTEMARDIHSETVREPCRYNRWRWMPSKQAYRAIQLPKSMRGLDSSQRVNEVQASEVEVLWVSAEDIGLTT